LGLVQGEIGQIEEICVARRMTGNLRRVGEPLFSDPIARHHAGGHMVGDMAVE
jgi:hypothetical protein